MDDGRGYDWAGDGSGIWITQEWYCSEVGAKEKRSEGSPVMALAAIYGDWRIVASVTK
jgi:hypothetical protein